MFTRKLDELRLQHLRRKVMDRSSKQGPKILLDGREFVNFSSNDYLGLANHPAVMQAAANAIGEFGFGGGASRLLGGGSVLHRMLEEKVARFKGTETALIFNSGHAANIGIIPAIAEEGDVLFSDELNHASIVDGCRLSRAKTVVYKHKDIAHLKALIKAESLTSSKASQNIESHSREGGNPLSPWIPGQARNDDSDRRKGKFIILTDTVFSMDGDIAPLKEIYDLCLSHNSTFNIQHPTFLYLDDAHGTGVLGNGKGALAHFDIKPEPWIIQMGTFSKALGSVGAFAAGSREIIEWLINSARSFFFSTALPACAAAASAKAIELIEEKPDLIEKLWRNRDRLLGGLKEMGFDTGETATPIIPLKMDTAENALRLSQYLYEKGIYAPAIRPPTVKTPRVRINITAAHSEEDIRALVDALNQIRQ